MMTTVDRQAAQAGGGDTARTSSMGTATYAIIMTIAIGAIAIIAIVFTRGEGALATSSLVESPAGRDALCAPHHIASRSELEEVAAACSFNDLLFNRYPATAKMMYKCNTSLLYGNVDPELLDYIRTLHTKYGDVIDEDIGDGCELVPSVVDAKYCTNDAVSRGYCVGSGVDYTALAYGRGPGQSCEDWNTQATVWEEGYDAKYVSLLEAECSGSDGRRLDDLKTPGCQEDMLGARDSRCASSAGHDIFEMEYDIHAPTGDQDSKFHVHFHNTGSVEVKGPHLLYNWVPCNIDHSKGTQWNRPDFLFEANQPTNIGSVTFRVQWLTERTTTMQEVKGSYPRAFIAGYFKGVVTVRNAMCYIPRPNNPPECLCRTVFTNHGARRDALVYGNGTLCGHYVTSLDMYHETAWQDFRQLCGCDKLEEPFCDLGLDYFEDRSCSCDEENEVWRFWPFYN